MVMDDRFSNWHALFVLTGQEDSVKERLLYRLEDQFEFFVPKRKLRERRNGVWKYNTKTLFPGYVLLKGSIDSSSYYYFKDIPGILKLLKCGSDILTVQPHEMFTLSKLSCNKEIIDFSSVLVENGQVKVVDGPLLSMEGNIVCVDSRKGRAKVRLDFLGQERVVDLGISVLRPA